MEASIIVPSHYHQVRRLQFYSSHQKILLVGEGDFSFSNSLAMAFQDGSNMIATSLDSYEIVLKKYADSAAFTIPNLKRLGAMVFHQVDATCMAAKSVFCNLIFDCIIYNFPHAGFSGSEDDKSVIKKHKTLVKLFFQNAAQLLKRGGEVHVAHKTKFPYNKWNLEKQAFKSGLVLKAAHDFHQAAYPGYVNRRGDGTSSGESFHLGLCKTFIFTQNPAEKLLLNPFWDLPHLLGQKSMGFLRKFLPGHGVHAVAPVHPPPHAPAIQEQSIFRLPFNVLGHCLKPRQTLEGHAMSLLPPLNLKRKHEHAGDAYSVDGMEDVAEDRRFLKRRLPWNAQMKIGIPVQRSFTVRLPPRPGVPTVMAAPAPMQPPQPVRHPMLLAFR